MSRRSRPTRVIQRVNAASAAGSALALLSATPAAAEVCDKAEGAFAGWLGLILIFATIAFGSAYATGRVWPALITAAVMVMLIAFSLSELAKGELTATAAWREGCGRSNMVSDVAAAAILIFLGFIGRRQFRARLGPVGDAATPNNEKA